MLCESNKEALDLAAQHEFLMTDPPSDTEEGVIVTLEPLLLILLQQLADEFFGQFAGVTEELLIELIVYG